MDDARDAMELTFQYTPQEVRALVGSAPRPVWLTLLAALRIPSAILPAAAWLAAWGYFGPALLCLAVFALACVLIAWMLFRSQDQVSEHALKHRRLRLSPAGLELENEDSWSCLSWSLFARGRVHHGMLFLEDQDPRGARVAIPLRSLPCSQSEFEAWLDRQLAAGEQGRPPDMPPRLPLTEPCAGPIEFTPTRSEELDALTSIGGREIGRPWEKRLLERGWLLVLVVMLSHLFDSPWLAGRAKYIVGAPVLFVAFLTPAWFLKSTSAVDRSYYRRLLPESPRPVRHTLYPDGWLSEGPLLRSFEQWSCISALHQRKSHLLAVCRPGNIHFIPWRTFPTVEARQTFVARAVELQAQPAGSAVVELTAPLQKQLRRHIVETGNPYQPPRLG